MNAQEYVPLARRTLKTMPNFRQHMIHMGMGIAGEFGELIDAAKKVLVYGKDYDHVNSIEEVGDVCWYIANLLPELEVEPVYMQRSLDRGYTRGLLLQQQHKIWEDCNYGEMLLGINRVIAEKAASLGQLNPNNAAGTSHVVAYIEDFAGNLGVVCGLLGVDPGEAMYRNIEKLAKRYGDKYSDLAALNRDLSEERKVLETPAGSLDAAD